MIHFNATEVYTDILFPKLGEYCNISIFEISNIINFFLMMAH